MSDKELAETWQEWSQYAGDLAHPDPDEAELKTLLPGAEHRRLHVQSIVESIQLYAGQRLINRTIQQLHLDL